MMPRTKLTTPETDAQFRAAVGETIKKALKDNPDAKITVNAAVAQMAPNTVTPETSQEMLRGLVDRIERLAAEKDELAEAIKEVYAEARGEGFEVKVLRLVVRRRKRRRQEVQEEDEMVTLYEDQLEG